MEIRKYAEILTKSWIIVLIATLLGLMLGIGFSLLVTPKYQSKTQLSVSVRSKAGTSGDRVQDANLSSKVVKSYVGAIKAEAVLEPVVKKLSLEITPSQLAGRVSATSPAQTSLINITATSTSAEEAAEIANAVGESLKNVVRAQLRSTHGAETSPIVTTTQVALTPASPVSPNTVFNTVMSLLIGLAIGIAVAIIRDIFDVRFNSLDDVKDVTDKSLLGGVINDPKSKETP